MQLQARKTRLHGTRALYFKAVLLATTAVSRFLHPYLVLATLAVNVALAIYAGAKRLLLAVFAAWCFLAAVVVSLDFAFSTLSHGVFLNLVYGFATFTSVAFLYVTTPPRCVREVLGLNAISLTYLFLGHSIKLVSELVDAVRARGWGPSVNPRSYVYPLKALSVLMVYRVLEATEALKARGLEE